MNHQRNADRHKTKVGTRRKECERILTEAVSVDARANSESEKAQLWDVLMKATREVLA